MILNFDISIWNGFINLVKINCDRNILKEGQEGKQYFWNKLFGSYQYFWPLVITIFFKIDKHLKMQKAKQIFKNSHIMFFYFFSLETTNI